MTETIDGGIPSKKIMKLDGCKVIVEKMGVYNGSVSLCYTREVIYHFKNEEEAKIFYYKKL